jgi:outer membrane beta-barrel protein
MIITERKIETHALYGISLSEAVANTSRVGIGLYYNWTEDHSLGILYVKNSSGLSSYSNQLNTKFGWDLSRAPGPDSTTLLDYNFKAYYGKMSLEKMAVGNFILFFSGSGGIVKYVHKTYPALSLGIGQKFFFNRSLSLRFDFRLQGHNAPNPFKKGLIENGTEVPAYNQFEDQFDLNQIAEVGLSFLF